MDDPLPPPNPGKRQAIISASLALGVAVLGVLFSNRVLPDPIHIRAVGCAIAMLLSVAYARLVWRYPDPRVSLQSFLPRFRFRFCLRLFVLVVIVAIPCAWSAYSLNWIQQRQAFVQRIINTGDATMVYWVGDRKLEPTAPGGLWIFRERGFASIMFYVSVDSQEIDRVQMLFPEAKISFPP